jgi:hypothetical protein
MCEDCDRLTELCWAEIRDLLNYNRKHKGPTAERLEGVVQQSCQDFQEEYGCEPDAKAVEAALIATRAEYIVIRLATIVKMMKSGPLSGAPISVIIGSWAGEAMQTEMTTRNEEKQLARLLYIPCTDDKDKDED